MIWLIYLGLCIVGVIVIRLIVGPENLENAVPCYRCGRFTERGRGGLAPLCYKCRRKAKISCLTGRVPERSGPAAKLPELVCGDCRACCIEDAVFLMDHEVGVYASEEYKGRHMLAHKPNGECFYLTPAGCGIHAIKPMKCKTMDCRNLALAFGAELDRLPVSPKVIAAGRERLDAYRTGLTVGACGVCASFDPSTRLCHFLQNEVDPTDTCEEWQAAEWCGLAASASDDGELGGES